jgi:hypothetical protein
MTPSGRGFNPLLDIDPPQLELDLLPGGCLNWADLGEDATKALHIMNGALAYWDQYRRPEPEPPLFYEYTPGTPEAKAAHAAYDAQLNAYLAAPYYPAATDAAFCLYHGRSTAWQHLNDFKSMADVARYFAWPKKIDPAAGFDDSVIYALLALIDAHEAIQALVEVTKNCMDYLWQACGDDVDLSLLVSELEHLRREQADRDAENRLYAVRLLATAKQYLMLAEWASALGASPEKAKEMVAANSKDAERGRKFPPGRRNGAVSDVGQYLRKIIADNPEASAKDLYHKIAATAAGENGCPWDEYTDDVLYAPNGKEMSFKAFQNQVSLIKNPKAAAPKAARNTKKNPG